MRLEPESIGKVRLQVYILPAPHSQILAKNIHASGLGCLPHDSQNN